jgi:hypothetical protein
MRWVAGWLDIMDKLAHQVTVQGGEHDGKTFAEAVGDAFDSDVVQSDLRADADEIDALRVRVAELEEALRPFVALYELLWEYQWLYELLWEYPYQPESLEMGWADELVEVERDHYCGRTYTFELPVKVRDVLAARSAMEGEKP